MAKKDVEVNLSEVLVHLRDSGAFRRALMEVAEKKAPGSEIGNITLKRSGGSELGDKDLDAVVGGAVATGTTIPQVAQVQYMGSSVRLPGFADTTW